MSNGLINFVLDSSNVDAARTAITGAMNQLGIPEVPKGVDLAGMVRHRPGTKEVVEGIADAQKEADWKASDPDPMLADLSVFLGLQKIEDDLAKALDRVRFYRFVGGSEAWNQALMRYGALRQMQRQNPALVPKLDRLQPLLTSRPLDWAPAAEDTETVSS